MTGLNALFAKEKEWTAMENVCRVRGVVSNMLELNSFMSILLLPAWCENEYEDDIKHR